MKDPKPCCWHRRAGGSINACSTTGIDHALDEWQHVLQTYTPTAPSYASTGFPLTNADSELSEATTSIQNAQVFVEEVINSSSPELLATPSPVQSPSQQFGTQASNQFGNQASNAPEGGQSASPESGGGHSAPFEGSLALMLGFFGFMALRRMLQQG